MGVDGSRCSRVALRWALYEAQVHGARLRAVWCYDTGESHRHRSGTALRQDAAATARHALSVAVADAREPATAAVEVEETVVHASGSGVADALLDRARDADLLVVGSHGAGVVRRVLLGSVSRRCTERATMPVVVVRGPTDG